jgi:hypothetical protein
VIEFLECYLFFSHTLSFCLGEFHIPKFFLITIIPSSIIKWFALYIMDEVQLFYERKKPITPINVHMKHQNDFF